MSPGLGVASEVFVSPGLGVASEVFVSPGLGVASEVSVTPGLGTLPASGGARRPESSGGRGRDLKKKGWPSSWSPAYPRRVPIPEDAYLAARDELLHRFRGWRPDRAIHDYADLALDFKFFYGDGEHLRWTARDVEAFLLDWVPRKVLLADGRYGELAAGIRDFFLFLAETGQLAPGSDPGEVLAVAVARHGPEMARRAVDPRHFGMAKGIVTGGGAAEPDPIPIPSRPPADLEEAERVAEASRAYRRLCTLHDYFAEPRPLTAKGNLKLADARHLIEALDTGDRMDEVIGDRQFKTKSSAELLGLVTIVGFAKEAGVLRTYGGKLAAVKRWTQVRDRPLEAVASLTDLMIEAGPLAYRPRWPGIDRQIFVLESSLPAILAALYEAPMTHEEILDAMAEAVLRVVELDDMGLRMLDRDVALSMEDILGALEDLGIVRWDGFETYEEYGRQHRRGGTLTLTSFGVYWCQTRLAGYGFVERPDQGPPATLADGPDAVVDALASTLAAGVDELVWAVMELGAPDEVAAAVESWWRVDHPQVGTVLEALEEAMPSPKVRRAAHRARFKHRNRPPQADAPE